MAVLPTMIGTDTFSITTTWQILAHPYLFKVHHDSQIKPNSIVNRGSNVQILFY